jgi:hypothetical protein
MNAIITESRRLEHLERRSWHRAITADALARLKGGKSEAILKANWPTDHHASLLLKAAVTPMATTDWPYPVDVIGAYRSLMPSAATWKLLSHPSALQLDLSGLHQIMLPHLDPGALPVMPVFIGENQPAPNLQMVFDKTLLGPARKILVLSAITEELEAASPQNASQIIGRILSDATNKSVDSIFFDANAGDAIRPPGLLNGVTATPAAAGTSKWENTQDDLANLVGAIADANIDASDAVFIANARDAVLIKERAGDLDNDVLTTLGLPRGTIVCIAPQGIASAYQGGPVVDIGKEAAWQFEANSPQQIVPPGGSPVAQPVISAFQAGLISIRVRAKCAWCAVAGAVSFIQNADW